MICNQAEVISGTISVLFERDESSQVIKNVPARICPACGEAFADEVVTVQLLNQAEEMASLGMRVAERDFS
jgi:YgiT-type zinc finger domain-containing protein